MKTTERLTDEELAARLAELGIERPPTQDELPYSDGMPMESQRHVLQMYLLMDPLWLAWADRQDVFVGGNMFVYYSVEQVRNREFLGPDVFVAVDVPRRERKSWVVWEEGRAPNVVIELLSASTAAQDKGEKKQIYQERLRVPEYFWYDPGSGELAGFALRNGVYEPIEPDAQGRLISRQLNLALTRWQGVYAGVEALWLRWATLEGDLLPTQQEAAEREHRLAEQERLRAEQERRLTEHERRRAEEAERRVAELEALLARYRQPPGGAPD